MSEPREHLCRDCPWGEHEGCWPGGVVETLECTQHRAFRVLRDEVLRLRTRNAKLESENRSLRVMDERAQAMRSMRSATRQIVKDIEAYEYPDDPIPQPTIGLDNDPWLDLWRLAVRAWAKARGG
ncbi:MAG: hypothetical protein DRQ56_10710 [Gammaproteobacteria bacterium]|nr:MAG: hypothetical protein DRQ56_10710 [Gammaproteobacteria bacterium]